MQSATSSLLTRWPLLNDVLFPAQEAVLSAAVTQDPLGPFEKDADFFDFVVAKVALTTRLHEVCAGLAKQVTDPRVSPGEGLAEMRAHQRDVKESLAECLVELDRVQALKVAAAEAAGRLPPRFVRLVRRLKLGDKEVRAMECILSMHCGWNVLRAQGTHHSNSLDLAAYAGMALWEVLNFASKSRAHIKQGIVLDVPHELRNDTDRQFIYSSPRASLSNETAKVLVGGRLSTADRLKLEETGALMLTLRDEEARDGDNGAAADAVTTEDCDGVAEANLDVGVSGAPARQVLASLVSGMSLAGALSPAGDLPTGDGVNRLPAKPPPLGASRPAQNTGAAGALLPLLPPSLPPSLLPLLPPSLPTCPPGVPSDPVDGDHSSGDEPAGDDALSSLLRAERRRDRRREQRRVQASQASQAGALEAEAPVPMAAVAEGDEAELRPYQSDLEYLVDAVELVAQKVRLNRIKQKIQDKGTDGRDEGDDEELLPPWHRRKDHQANDQQRERELQGKVRVLARRLEERARLTRQVAAEPTGSGWVPRLERILESRKMTAFEQEVLTLLVGSVLLPAKLRHVMGPMNHPAEIRRGIRVGDLLASLCESLAEQISHRAAFYKDAVLVRDSMIHVGSNGLKGDLTACSVEVDRRMVDFVVGLDSEVHQLVEGSQLYTPQARMDSVVLPEETKALIVSTVQTYPAFRRLKRNIGMDETMLATGLVMLFFGDSGTGKTMTANAVADLLGKRVLLINFPSLGDNAAEVVRVIFRESRINDAVLFFDECEAIFESRDRSRCHNVNMLLTELERHDGLVILATNRPFDLDEAMHRRITLAIEFHRPDHLLRREIWRKLLPPALPLAPDVDLAALAMRYELSGGFIKNAILSALSIACGRQQSDPSSSSKLVVTQEDLVRGAQLQLRGRLAMRSFERRIVPKGGLDTLVCSDELLRRLQAVVDFEKSKTVLYGQWGFGGRAAFSGGEPEIGSPVLFYGPPGTGKSLAAQAIGFEVGRPLKVVNAAHVLNKYVGQTGKNIEKVFEEARAMEAILVFDEAEGLFGRRSAEASSSVDKHANLDTGLLLYWLEHYPGLCVLTTNTKDAIDPAFFRRFRFLVEFTKPDLKTRTKLWQSCLPPQAPRAADVDFAQLAAEFPAFSGGDIQNVVIRGAAKAALRSPEEQRVIRMEDLRAAAREESSKGADDALHRLYA